MAARRSLGRYLRWPTAAAPPDEAWALVCPVLDMGWKGRAAVVDGILYSYDYLGQVKPSRAMTPTQMHGAPWMGWRSWRVLGCTLCSETGIAQYYG